jgi:hypothetical protein
MHFYFLVDFLVLIYSISYLLFYQGVGGGDSSSVEYGEVDMRRRRRL